MKKKSLIAAGVAGALLAAGAGTAVAAAAPDPSSPAADAAGASAALRIVDVYAEPDVHSAVVGTYVVTVVDQYRATTAGNGGRFLHVPTGWALVS